MQGILLVDKPREWTSFDVVNYVRKIVANTEGKKPKNAKVGHTGTLDPLATGLLVLLIGKEYTRKAEQLAKVDKTYDVIMRLGQTSATGDDEGEKSDVSDMQPDEAAIHEALAAFQGDIMQVPPVFSAMKVDGQRAYKLARQGRQVALEPRPVRIDSIVFEKYEYPYVKFTAEVSSGTYIRSLVVDIGERLGTGAYMSGLRRTCAGEYGLGDAVAVSDLSSETIADRLLSLPR